jgi:lysozyme family protein
MDDSFDVSLEFTLNEEGGFIDHPSNPRFATNFGITLARLRRFLRDPSLGRDDIRGLPCATVRAIYMADFWNRPRCDALPPGIDLMAFDHSVNAGPDRAGRALQLAVGHKRCDIDGAIGPDTLSRVAMTDTLTLLDAVTATQRASYRQMAAFGLFGDGWLARLDRRRARALALMAEPVSRR